MTSPAIPSPTTTITLGATLGVNCSDRQAEVPGVLIAPPVNPGVR